MHQEIIMTGFGGQGILAMGHVLVLAGMKDGKNVVWYPSYGPEMRGGEAHCSVIVSTEEIGSPIVSEPNSLLMMDSLKTTQTDGKETTSLQLMFPNVKPGGLILLNSTLIHEEVPDNHCQVVRIPVSDTAERLGNPRVANMILLGAYIELTKAVDTDQLLDSLNDFFPNGKKHLIPINQQAIKTGMDLVKEESAAGKI